MRSLSSVRSKRAAIAAASNTSPTVRKRWTTSPRPVPGAQNNIASLPKLILLDLHLHKIGGLEVLRQLKSGDRTKGIPIVVLTASKVAIELADSYKLGVNSYVLKPTGAKQFTDAVAAIVHYWMHTNEPPQL